MINKLHEAIVDIRRNGNYVEFETLSGAVNKSKIYLDADASLLDRDQTIGNESSDVVGSYIYNDIGQTFYVSELGNIKTRESVSKSVKIRSVNDQSLVTDGSIVEYNGGLYMMSTSIEIGDNPNIPQYESVELPRNITPVDSIVKPLFEKFKFSDNSIQYISRDNTLILLPIDGRKARRIKNNSTVNTMVINGSEITINNENNIYVDGKLLYESEYKIIDYAMIEGNLYTAELDYTDIMIKLNGTEIKYIYANMSGSIGAIANGYSWHVAGSNTIFLSMNGVEYNIELDKEYIYAKAIDDGRIIGIDINNDIFIMNISGMIMYPVTKSSVYSKKCNRCNSKYELEMYSESEYTTHYPDVDGNLIEDIAVEIDGTIYASTNNRILKISNDNGIDSTNNSFICSEEKYEHIHAISLIDGKLYISIDYNNDEVMIGIDKETLEMNGEEYSFKEYFTSDWVQSAKVGIDGVLSVMSLNGDYVKISKDGSILEKYRVKIKGKDSSIITDFNGMPILSTSNNSERVISYISSEEEENISVGIDRSKDIAMDSYGMSLVTIDREPPYNIRLHKTKEKVK